MSREQSLSSQVRTEVLKRGGFSSKMAPLRKAIMVFVSSTFTDTMEERSILQEKILPELKNAARAHGGMEYIFFSSSTCATA